jgi:ubiquinone/menaquinone biosynthesis C-methylase UbiE
MQKDDVRRYYDSIASRYDSASNKYCNARYLEEIKKYIHKNDIIIELGCGSGAILSKLHSKTKIGCELSFNFFKSTRIQNQLCVQADAETLPLKNTCANIVFHINLIEHVANPGQVIREGMRLLKTGGRQIIITPNGDLAFLLEIAEKFHLKIPEGPHRFLNTRDINRIITSIEARVIKYNKIITLPFGSPSLQSLGAYIEGFLKTGLFHFIILEKNLPC